MKKRSASTIIDFLRKVLFNSFNYEGACFASKRALAKQIGCVVRTVQKFQRRCLDAGLIVVESRKLTGNRDGSSLIYLTDLGYEMLMETLDAPTLRAYNQKASRARYHRDIRLIIGEGRTRPFLPVIKCTGRKPGRTARANRGKPPLNSVVATLKSEEKRLNELIAPTPWTPSVHPVITPCSPNRIKDPTELTECTGQASESREIPDVDSYAGMKPTGAQSQVCPSDPELDQMLGDFPEEIAETFRCLTAEKPVGHSSLLAFLRGLRMVSGPNEAIILTWESHHGFHPERMYVPRLFRELFRKLYPGLTEPIFQIRIDRAG